MTSSQPEESDAVGVVTMLIAQLGIGGLVGLIAETTQQQSDYFRLSGELQKAEQCMRDLQILERAARSLGR